MSLTTYTKANVTNAKQFKAAITTVFSGVKARNEQIQQLLILAVEEASRVSGGQVTNNLTWLSNLVALADKTHGVNAKRITRYIINVLCKETVKLKIESNEIVKRNKTTPIAYDTSPVEAWFTYEQAQDKAKKAVVLSEQTVTKFTDRFLSQQDSDMTLTNMLSGILNSDKVSINDLMQAMDSFRLAEAS